MDNKLPETEYQGLLLGWLNGDTEAFRFCCLIMWVSHLWDDLIDKDNPRTDDEINRAFQIIMAEIPHNRFYQTYSPQLAPLVASAALQYPIANKLEHGRDGEKVMAFAMRNMVLHIVPQCFFLIGGVELYNKSAEEFYRYISTNLKELFSDFWKEMQNV